MTSVLVADSKYQFVPPHEGKLWPRLLGRLMPHFLKRKHGITEVEVRGDEAIRRLQQSGHGIVLAPNHCRMSDAIVLQSLSRQLNQPFYIMDSSHLFRGSRLLAWCCDDWAHSAFIEKALMGRPSKRASTFWSKVNDRWFCFPKEHSAKPMIT